MDVFQNISVLGQEISLLGSGQFFVDIAVALICGLLIALFYRWTYGRLHYSAVFVNSLVALSMITTIVITVIGNNLARAFGLVGALSIIRFRLAIKDMKDIVFVFLALAVGMAAGVGLPVTAITGAIFIGTVMFILSRTHGASPKRQALNLRISFTPPAGSGETKAPYRPILEQHCRQYELIKAKPSKSSDALTLSYSVNLKGGAGESLIYELGRIPGVSQVTLTRSGGRSRKRRKSRHKSTAEGKGT
jgi:uncharacterized membrane protein YhiD involved in acid resistance